MKKMNFNGAQPIGEVLTPEEMKAISGGFGSGSGSGSEEGLCTCTLRMEDDSTQEIPPFKAFDEEDCAEQCHDYCLQNEDCVQSSSTFF